MTIVEMKAETSQGLVANEDAQPRPTTAAAKLNDAGETAARTIAEMIAGA
jgi:hypothetical protein